MKASSSSVRDGAAQAQRGQTLNYAPIFRL